jgi:hypothetical protein
VNELLTTQDQSVLIISNPLLDPCSFDWRLTNGESKSRLLWNGITVFDHEIESVFVRTFGWIDPTGWQKDDLAYMQSETHAALLAWLSSLSCPVVNRYSPDIWYRPKPPLLFWQPLLRRSGLRIIETLITNEPEEANNFRQQLNSSGIAGAVYNSLTNELSYLVTEEEEWNGIKRMQERSPVCITHPHGEPVFVCVVGDEMIWNDGSPTNMRSVGPFLAAFAKNAGLTFVELALTTDGNDLNVIAVDPYPKWDHFGSGARQQIVKRIITLLTAKDQTKNPALQH